MARNHGKCRSTAAARLSSEQRASASAPFLQIPFQKRADVIAGQEFERELAHGVVAARQHGNFVIPIPFLGRLNDVA